MAGAPGEMEKLCSSLGRWFERRLLDHACGEHNRSAPVGYRPEFCKETQCFVVKHEASAIRACAHAADLVERVDRGRRPGPARVVYIYLKALDAFIKAANQAHREPTQMWRKLVEFRILRAAEESAGGTWYVGPITASEPSAVAADALRSPPASPMAGGGAGGGASASAAEWLDARYCLAVHLPAHQCRSSRNGSAGLGALELWFPGPPPREASAGLWHWPPATERSPEVDHGLRLVEAAARRDAETVRALLEAKANPDFQDPRGWTALHAACAVKPKWEVLDQLLSVCDLCVRNHAGLVPCDLSDAGAHEEVSVHIKELMMQHPKAKHLPQATSALSAAAKAALGITSVDWVALARRGKRMGEEEAAGMLLDFAVLMMSKYKNSDEAFRAFDINGNGTISNAEFIHYAKSLNFAGDVVAIFKAIDVDRQGDISKVEFRLLQQLYDEYKQREMYGQE